MDVKQNVDWGLNPYTSVDWTREHIQNAIQNSQKPSPISEKFSFYRPETFTYPVQPLPYSWVGHYWMPNVDADDDGSGKWYEVLEP